jgi:GxxExxY protein
MIRQEHKYSDLTGSIIGCAMEVHNQLGNGFQACLPKGSMARRQEVIYQRSLSIEMNLQDISHEREKELPLKYKRHDVDSRRVDFFVENTVMVEIKAIKELEDVHLAQAMNYVEAYHLDIGLLINFG